MPSIQSVRRRPASGVSAVRRRPCLSGPHVADRYSSLRRHRPRRNSGGRKPQAPDWAYPGTATRTQVPPPPDFRRPSTHYKMPIGLFEGQSDIGTAVVPGSASFDAATGRYTIASAGYNIWYYRDEFRFLWKRMSGDVSLAADIAYPDPNGYGDRKAVLVIRQDLDDDSVQVVVAPHGAGMIQLAQRPTRGARVTDLEFRVGSRGGRPGGAVAGQPGRHHGQARRPREARRHATRCSSAWTASRCTSSARPSRRRSTGRSTSASGSARTCPTRGHRRRVERRPRERRRQGPLSRRSSRSRLSGMIRRSRPCRRCRLSARPRARRGGRPARARPEEARCLRRPLAHRPRRQGDGDDRRRQGVGDRGLRVVRQPARRLPDRGHRRRRALSIHADPQLRAGGEDHTPPTRSTAWATRC